MSTSPVARLMARLENYVDRPWYLPTVAALAGSDVFILVVPTDGLVVTSVLLKPKRWIRTALWFTAGSVLGAWLFCWATEVWGQQFVLNLLGDLAHGESWADASRFIAKYGKWALFILGATPLPLQPAVALCALSGIPSSEIALILLAGRLPKFLTVSWLASHAPDVLQRFGLLSREVSAIQEAATEIRSKSEPSDRSSQ